MKAKFYTVILSALLLAGFPAKAQFADNRDFRNDDAGIVINNYYDDYDYYYSSRINRFHRSYSAFDYYSPVFTDTYWYNYQPYSWGASIYGRSGLGFGFSINFPVYYYGWGTDYWYDYNYGWYDPYYGSSWYWGYDPYYYSWYSPVVFSINIGPRWRNNFWCNDYRPMYHAHNNYYYHDFNSPRYSFRDFPDRNRPGEFNRTNPGGPSRRESIPAPDSKNQMNNRSSANQGNATSPSRSQGYSGSQPNRSSSPAASRSDAGSGRTYSAPSRSSSSPRGGTRMSQGRSSSSGSAARSSAPASRSRSSSSSKSSSGSSSRSSSKDRR
jgi:hypothetical protein